MIRAARVVVAAAQVRGAIEKLLDELGHPPDPALSRGYDRAVIIEEEHRDPAHRIEASATA